MSKHQIIFTSCKRGIDGVNDGQQVFSYDENFQGKLTQEIRSNFGYRVPSLPTGVVMSDEIVGTLPQSFKFGQLSNGSLLISLNSYLGHDYMGSHGRFGNILSHVIVLNNEELDIYPCELYKSETLRSKMKFEEVNNPDRPEYLQTPVLERGCLIDEDSILEFLEDEDNLEYFKYMFDALLRYGKSKHIVICDENDNIVKWTAALHYALPLEIAKTVSFNTYDYNPSNSQYLICGVVGSGTDYSPSSYTNLRNVALFDLENSVFNTDTTESKFLNFIESSILYSIDSLKSYKEFIIERTSYRDYDIGYIEGYYLYCLFLNDLSKLGINDLKNALNFATEYMFDSSIVELCKKLLNQGDYIICQDNDYSLFLLSWMLENINKLDDDSQNLLKKLIGDCLIEALVSDNVSESTYLDYYEKLLKIAKAVNFSIPTYLMNLSNISDIFSRLMQSDEWKTYFIFDLIRDYVVDASVPSENLCRDFPIGSVLCNLFKSCYENRPEMCDELILRILKSFSFDCNYFINMTLNIEGYLLDYNNQGKIDYLWKSFTEIIRSKPDDFILYIEHELLKFQRYDEMLLIFKERINQLSSFEEVNQYFFGYLSTRLVEAAYPSEFVGKVVEAYGNKFLSSSASMALDEQIDCLLKILNVLIQKNVQNSTAEKLADYAGRILDFNNLKKNNGVLFEQAVKYKTNVLHSNLTGNLLLIYSGYILRSVNNISTISSACDEVLRVSGGLPIDCTSLNIKWKDFYNWAYSQISKFRLKADDYSSIYQLFGFDEKARKEFISYWCKNSNKKYSRSEGYAALINFVYFVLNLNIRDDEVLLGKCLCGVGSKKLEEIDQQSQKMFSRNSTVSKRWKEVIRVAKKTNPLFNNLGNIFRK